MPTQEAGWSLSTRSVRKMRDSKRYGEMMTVIVALILSVGVVETKVVRKADPAALVAHLVAKPPKGLDVSELLADADLDSAAGGGDAADAFVLPPAPSHRDLAASEVWRQLESAFVAGDIAKARRLEVFYDSILEETDESFLEHHDEVLA